MQLKSETKPRVLVVEDDAVVRVYTERVVLKGGYEVVSVSSGEEALSLLAEDHDVDIALMDIMMPGMSGFELLDALKANPKTSDIRVIMLTALNQVEDKVRAFSCGASDYISKPFESKELLARLATQTRLKTAEENLLQSEEMFKSLVTHASDVITVTALDGTVIYTNDATCKLLGYEDAAQAAGLNVYEFVAPESRHALQDARREVLAHGVITNHELHLQLPDGSIVPVEMTTSLLRDSDGNPNRYISITRDISERKMVEIAMRRRLEMEKLLSNISTDFSSIKESDLSEKVCAALEKVGRFTEVDNCNFIMAKDVKNRLFEVYEWDINKPDEKIHRGDIVSLNLYSWSEEFLSKNEALYVPDVSALPPEAEAEKKQWSKKKIHALIAIPLFVNDELCGTISVDWKERLHTWLDGDTRLLRLVGEIFVNAVQRQRGLQAIQHFNERLEGMHDIDQAILSAQSAQTIVSSALGHLQKLVPYFSAEVVSINLEMGEFELLASQVGKNIQEGAAQRSAEGLLSLPPDLLKGELWVVQDVGEQPLEYDIEKSLISQGAKSFIIAPLIFHDEFSGVIILVSEQAGVFTRENLLVVREVADMLALGIKNALLFAEARETVEREMRLDEVNRIISGTLDVDIIIKEVVRLSVELVNAEASSFFILASDMQSLASCYHQGLPEGFENVCQPHEWEVTRLSLCDKQSVIENDYASQQEAIELLVKNNFKRMMCVPVQASGVQMGALLMFRKEGMRKFNNRDLWIIETVGRQAGAAIQNAMFYQSERHRVQELEAMSDIVADTLGELDLTMLLEAVVVRSVALLDTTGGELGLYDDATQETNILVSFGLDKDYTNSRLKLGEGVMGHVADNHMPLMIKNYTKWHGHSKNYAGLGSSAVLAVPLVARKKLLGILEVVDSNPQRVFRPEDMHLLNLFGQQAAVAMDNAMLYRAAQQRAIEAETLQQVSSVIATKLNLDETIDAILEQLARVIPYDSATVQLIRNEWLEVVGGHGFKHLKDIMGLHYPVTGKGPHARVLETGEPLMVSDCQQEFQEYFGKPLGVVRSWLGVPLKFQKRNVGIIALNSMDVAHFNHEQARMVTAFADQVAIAIENARLFEEAQKRVVEAETLRKAGAVVAAQLQSEAAIDSILQQVMLVVPCDSASVQLLQNDEMVVVGGLGKNDVPSPMGLKFSIKGKTPNAMVYKTRKPLILGDAPQMYEEFIKQPFNEIHSWLGVPLIIHDDVIGLVAMGSMQKDYFTEENARQVSAFADQVGIALENARLFEETQRLATTDPLTELYNRRHFFDLSHVELERACRYHRNLSVMMLDIDRFKRVNDRYGHLNGDHVLRTIARRIRSSLREIDITGRYGGEEFVVLMPETGAQEAYEAAERVRQTIADTLIEIENHKETITISVGVVSLEHGKKVDIEILFDRADQALYAAKQAGRNRVKAWRDIKLQNDAAGGV